MKHVQTHTLTLTEFNQIQKKFFKTINSDTNGVLQTIKEKLCKFI